jgi:dihydrofolate reductase
MGLLRFPVIANLVPSDARNVYVMSEDERRKTRNGEASFCTQILFNLHKYLAQQFPDKTVVVLRGAKIFDDMTRLALAPVCVASLSSFSLFAAMTNRHKAFFPAVPPHTKDSIFNNHQVKVICPPHALFVKILIYE